MHRHWRVVSLAGLLGATACGGVKMRENPPTPEHPGIPRITAERLQECVHDFGHQLVEGSWAFSPVVQVDHDGRLVDVHVGDIPNGAPDLAACTREALGAMVIPSSVFNMRRTQSTASTDEASKEQRTHLGNPVVVVVVVVGLGEIVLEAGAATILFAVTVKVVEKAKDDVEEALKRRPPVTDEKNECIEGYERCILSGGGVRGNNWNTTVCENCLRFCKGKGGWPYSVPMFGKGNQLCY